MDPTKARLLEAAGEEFAERGFAGATVRSICRRAGANVAAVNYHFGDKEQLYHQAVVEAHRCGLGDPIATGPGCGRPEDQLRAFVRQFLEQVLTADGPQSWHRALMLREMIRPTDASETLVRESIRPRFEGLRRILQALDPAADATRLDALCFSVVGQCLHYKVGRPIAERLVGPEALARLDADYLTDHITGLMLAALRRAPGPPSPAPAPPLADPPHAPAAAPGVPLSTEGPSPCPGSR